MDTSLVLASQTYCGAVSNPVYIVVPFVSFRPHIAMSVSFYCKFFSIHPIPIPIHVSIQFDPFQLLRFQLNLCPHFFSSNFLLLLLPIICVLACLFAQLSIRSAIILHVMIFNSHPIDLLYTFSLCVSLSLSTLLVFA